MARLDQVGFMHALVDRLPFLDLPPNPDDSLVDLGFDSIDVLSILAVVEDLADCNDPPMDPPVLTTMNELFEYYSSLA